MEKLFIVATENEFKKIFDGFQFEINAFEKNLHYSRCDKFWVLVTGVGKIKATMESTNIIVNMLQLSPVEVINIGVCGADKDFEIGEVVEINQVNEFDFSTEPFDDPIDIAKEHTIHLPAKVGVCCLTADKVATESAGLGTPVIYDMEAYAVAAVCKEYEQHCRIIKAVTDIVEHKDQSKMYENNFSYACEKLNTWVKKQNKKGEN